MQNHRHSRKPIVDKIGPKEPEISLLQAWAAFVFLGFGHRKTRKNAFLLLLLSNTLLILWPVSLWEP